MSRKMGLRRMGLRSLAGGGRSARSDSVAQITALLGADRLAHWDATEAASISLSGSSVTGLQELVNGTVYVPGIASTRPAYSATGFNGGPSIESDGVDDYLFASEVLGPTGASASEIWACVSQDVLGSVVGAQQVIGYGSTSTANTSRGIGRINVSSVNRTRAVVGTGAAAPSATDTATDFSGFHVIRGTFGATTTSISIDGGTPATVAAVPSTATSRTVLFASMALASGFFMGKFSCGLITLPLSTEKASALFTLLQKRYQ